MLGIDRGLARLQARVGNGVEFSPGRRSISMLHQRHQVYN